jgi:sugar transferase (PEP-CTERM/EpsH1 system associated)
VKVKLLWLKSELLHPVDKGGRIRSYHMLKRLKREHEITYLSFVSPDDPAEATDLADEYSDRLVRVPREEPQRFSARFYRDLAFNLGSPLPYALQKYRSSAMRRAIEREVAEGGHTVVVCDFLVPSVNLPSCRPAVSVLFQHNVESMIWRRHYETETNMVKKAYFFDQWRKMYWYERAACRRFDAVITVSRADRDQIAAEFRANEVYDVPTGVDTDYFKPADCTPSPAEIVFTGSMDWMPNEDAVIYFAESILPSIARAAPDVSLSVVGRNPTKKLLALAEQNRRIRVTGRVDDIRPYVARAAAFVVPIRVGGGTRLKIFEAMAMAKPVVSTTVGAEGLPVRDGRELLIADDPEDFARAVVRVLSDAHLARRIGEQAHAYVNEQYGWGGAASAFAKICERAVRRKTRASIESRVMKPQMNTDERG